MRKTYQENQNTHLNKEFKQILKARNLRLDGGEDRMLQNRVEKVDFAGKDLDIPGRKIHKAQKELIDEENSLYGQGGESNQNLEQPERANS